MAHKIYNVPQYSIHLVIVESFRKKGKPRQRVLKYLGSIRESQLKNPATRKEFLKFIEHRIDLLELLPRIAAHLKVELIRKTIQYNRPF